MTSRRARSELAGGAGDRTGGPPLPDVPPGVHVRHAVPPPRPAPADLALLSPEERRRAACIRKPAAAARHVTGRALLRRLLGTLLDVPPADVALRVGEDGRPGLAGPDPGGVSPGVSVAHTDGMVVVAAAPTAVGIDVERTDRWPLPPLDAWMSEAERRRLGAGPEPGAAAPADRRLVRAWTAKEATAKGLGRGTCLALAVIEVDGPIAHVRADVGPEPVTWHLHDVAVATTHVVTLALPAPPPPPHEWAHGRGTWPTSSPARSLSPR